MLLEIENLDVSFKGDDGKTVEAAKNVSLSLDRGEVLGIVGESARTSSRCPSPA